MTQDAEYVMTYFHPRDFDKDQPMIPNLSLTRKFKSYYGLEGAFNKLLRYVDDFDFIDLKQADKLTDWHAAENVQLP